MENSRYNLEIAKILREEQSKLESSYKLALVQQKAIRDLSTCRTSAQGGHLLSCNSCSYQRPAYNSCRNRHCPKCQFIKQEMWVDKVASRLLPGNYFTRRFISGLLIYASLQFILSLLYHKNFTLYFIVISESVIAF